jgi:hypothetical protein
MGGAGTRQWWGFALLIRPMYAGANMIFFDCFQPRAVGMTIRFQGIKYFFYRKTAAPQQTKSLFAQKMCWIDIQRTSHRICYGK